MAPERGTASENETPQAAARCLCSSGDTFENCCRPLLQGAPAPTAERLMRSRYTAFAMEDAEYLLRTWHPTTRPHEIEFEPGLQWRRLLIVDRMAGGPFDRQGVVEFEAFWRQGSQRGTLHERSSFVREGRDWFYTEGEVR
ncbi:YchJ family metal-binding protein [Microbacterium sp. NPDC076768]|uniref:YchJ family protein n=1 Tax=Microbacterium sp. NPDC076768 TaxID=3154858 RepID=UPI00343D2AC9